MAAAQTTLQLILKANNEATVAINEVHASLQSIANVQFAGLQAELGKLNQNVTHLASAHQSAARAAHEHENALGRLGEKLRDVGKLATGLALGAGLVGGVSSLEEFAKGTVEATQNAQAFQTQLTTLYGNAGQAGKAIEYLNQNAAKVAFPEDQIRQSAAAFVQMGANITQTVPLAENLAAKSKVSLTDATHAITQAMAGHFRGLQATLHVSAGELEAFGLQFDKHGKVIQSTFLPALERLTQSKFGDAAAQQSNTWAGATTRLHNVFEQLQEKVGEAALPSITKALGQLGDAIASHMPQLQHFADALGRGIATAIKDAGPVLKGFTEGIKSVGTALGPVVTAIGGAASHFHLFGSGAKTSGQSLEGLGKTLGVVLPAIIGVGLAFKAAHVAIDTARIAAELYRGVAQAVQVVTKAWTAVQAGLNLVLAANPIALVILAVSALVAAFILAYTHIKPFHEWVNNLWKVFTTNLLPVLHAVAGFLVGSLKAAWATAQVAIGAVWHVAQVLWTMFDQNVLPILKTVAGFLLGSFKASWETLTSIVGGVLTTLQHFWAFLNDTVFKNIGTVASGIQNALCGAFSAVQGAVEGFMKSLAGVLSGIGGLLAHVPGMSGLAHAIAGFVTGAERTAGGAVRTAAGAVTGATGAVAGAVGSAAGAVGRAYQRAEVTVDRQNAVHHHVHYHNDVHHHMHQHHDVHYHVHHHAGGGGVDRSLDVRGPSGGMVDTAAQQRTAARDAATQERHQEAEARRTARAHQHALDQALQNARKIFGDDLVSLGRTTQDYNRLLGDAKTVRQDEINAGVKRSVVEADYQAALKRIADHMKQQAQRRGQGVFAPRPAFGTLGHEVSYGEVAVAFGGTSRDPSSAIISALHQQIQHLQDQVRRDDQIIGLLKAGGNTAERQLSALVDIRGGVLRPGPPSPSPTNAHAAVRSTGGSIPVVRG